MVVDASSCTEGFLKLFTGAGGPTVRVIDAVQSVTERMLPVLGAYERLDSVSVHPTCSSTQLGMNDALHSVAAAAHASCNRTGELGMTRATGQPYRRILELLAEVASVSSVQ